MWEMAENSDKTPANRPNCWGNEAVLIDRFNKGDESAFEQIMKENAADVAALANRLLGWPGEVEDVVQNVFVKAFTGLRKFRRRSRLKTWLFAITINECRRHRRRQMLRLRLPAKAHRNLSSPAAFAGVMNGERLNRVRRAVLSLPAKYREAVVLRYLQGLSMKQASEVLGITVNALHVRLTRARQRLKRNLTGLLEE